MRSEPRIYVDSLYTKQSREQYEKSLEQALSTTTDSKFSADDQLQQLLETVKNTGTAVLGTSKVLLAAQLMGNDREIAALSQKKATLNLKEPEVMKRNSKRTEDPAKPPSPRDPTNRTQKAKNKMDDMAQRIADLGDTAQSFETTRLLMRSKPRRPLCVEDTKGREW